MYREPKDKLKINKKSAGKGKNSQKKVLDLGLETGSPPRNYMDRLGFGFIKHNKPY
jgi:hypothetical protein